MPFQDWRTLPSLLRDLDINLAPLEPDSRFNEAKSAVKWLEAAWVGAPAVASPTEPFTRVIQQGVNGLLASDEAEWVQHLCALLKDATLRRRLGDRARRDALLDYPPAVQGRRYLDILERAAATRRADEAVDGEPARESDWGPVLPDEPFTPVELEPYGAPGLRRTTSSDLHGGWPARPRPLDTVGEDRDQQDAYIESLVGDLRVKIDTLLARGVGSDDGQRYALPGVPGMTYDHWLADVEAPERMRRYPELPTDGPLISVVVPLYRPAPEYLRRCVESVLGQSYRNLQLCLRDDGSNDPALTAYLGGLAHRDDRIRVTDATGSPANGAWIALLDPLDLLRSDALAEVAAACLAHPDAGVIYSDDDRIDREDRRFEPNFKPEWSPDLLTAYPYLGHLLVVRADIMHELGRIERDSEGDRNFDLMLRATELADQVIHVSHVLYHRRAVAASPDRATRTDAALRRTGRRALTEAIERRGLVVSVHDGPLPGSYAVRRRVSGQPSLSVIAHTGPTAGPASRLLHALGVGVGVGVGQSLSGPDDVDPGYEVSEVVLVDNGTGGPEMLAWRRQLHESPQVRVVDLAGTTGRSARNNVAAATCQSDLLLFIDNDVAATKDGWLHALVEEAQRNDVGAVGPRLLRPDTTAAIPGVIVGHCGIAPAVPASVPGSRPTRLVPDAVIRACSAVSAACLMTRRSVFAELGEFDESLTMDHFDLDYCLRLADAGYVVLYTPHAELVQHDAQGPGADCWSNDTGRFIDKWGAERLRVDPCYNPNLSLLGPACNLRVPGEMQQWESKLDALSGTGTHGRSA